MKANLIDLSDLVDYNLSLDCPRSLDLIFDPVLIKVKQLSQSVSYTISGL